MRAVGVESFTSGCSRSTTRGPGGWVHVPPRRAHLRPHAPLHSWHVARLRAYLRPHAPLLSWHVARLRAYHRPWTRPQTRRPIWTAAPRRTLLTCQAACPPLAPGPGISAPLRCHRQLRRRSRLPAPACWRDWRPLRQQCVARPPRGCLIHHPRLPRRWNRLNPLKNRNQQLAGRSS